MDGESIGGGEISGRERRKGGSIGGGLGDYRREVRSESRSVGSRYFLWCGRWSRWSRRRCPRRCRVGACPSDARFGVDAVEVDEVLCRPPFGVPYTDIGDGESVVADVCPI